MIKFIATEDTLPLRSKVLRDGAPIAECYFQTDDLETTFHMGYVSTAGDLAAVVTCLLEPVEGYEGLGYRIRGMATDPDWQGKGIGTALLTATIDYLTTGLLADYIWCHGRRIAYGFYQHLGFEPLSEEFEIPGIGPHKVMFLKLG